MQQQPRQFGGREAVALALENKGDVPFETAPFHASLGQARERFPTAGPLLALDAAIDGLGLPALLPEWGSSATRQANLDALRAHAVRYVGRADADGSAATPAGLVAYFELLESEGLDDRASLSGSDSVVVSTWHAAKGLEWPITVLGLLGADRDPPRFGFTGSACWGLGEAVGASRVNGFEGVRPLR